MEAHVPSYQNCVLLVENGKSKNIYLRYKLARIVLREKIYNLDEFKQKEVFLPKQLFISLCCSGNKLKCCESMKQHKNGSWQFLFPHLFNHLRLQTNSKIFSSFLKPA